MCIRGAAGPNPHEIIWLLHYVEPHLHGSKQSSVAFLKVGGLDYVSDTTLYYSCSWELITAVVMVVQTNHGSMQPCGKDERRQSVSRTR